MEFALSLTGAFTQECVLNKVRVPKKRSAAFSHLYVHILIQIFSGLPQSGKKSGNKIVSQDHGKVMEFWYKSVKMSFFEKVRENQYWSGNFLFFIWIFQFYFESFHP